jgi:DUF4097 and DUF4098 domain-containing protein YvlB
MEVTMRRPILVAALVVLLVTAGCRQPSTPLAIHETHTFPVAPGKLVKLDLRSLDVHVKVAEASAITVTVDLQARASSKAAAQRWIQRNAAVFEDSPSTLEVYQPRGTRGIWVIGFMHTEGKLELTVPPSCRLEIRTASGDVTIAGEVPLSSAVRVKTASGDVHVTGGARELIVNTASGDVRVSGPPLALVEADSASGDITVESGAEKAIFDTASGDVRVKKLTGDLMANTASGDVSVVWERLAAGAKVHVRTTSGDIGLRIPESALLRGEVSTTSGRISSDFAGSSDRREHRLSFAGSGEGVEIEVRTTSGDAALHKSS